MNKALKNFMNKLFFTCEKATFLMEKKASDEPIGVINNIRLNGHIAICKWCNAYCKKVTIIDSALGRIAKNSNEAIEEADLNDFQNHLIEKMLKKS